jgi:death-on-curing protein
MGTRVGHAAKETLLVLNGAEVVAPVDEQDAIVLSVASGQISREQFTEWLAEHVAPTIG